MGKAHKNQKKTAQLESKTNELATRKMNTINRKQHSNPYGRMEFIYGGAASNSNIEILQRFQSKTFQSILNAPWRINNHRIHEDLQMNTVLSEINKWNTKHLRKSENHTNALAVNLVDKNKTTQTEKI
jgi:hypothetical protein